jgi:hypothetical protein
MRKEGSLWHIKCQGQVNLVDVKHFNTPPHLTTLAKHVFNIREENVHHRKRPALISCKSYGPYSLSKDALRENECP